MVSPIQTVPVEVENTSKESTSSPASGFADVLAKTVSQASEGDSGTTERATAKRDEKAKRNSPKESVEKELTSGEAASLTSALPVATSTLVVNSDNAFQAVEPVEPSPISAASAPLEDSKKLADRTAIAPVQGEKEAAVPRAPAQGTRGETLALTGVQTVYSEAPQPGAATVDNSQPGAEGTSGEGAQAGSTRTAEISAANAKAEVADVWVQQKIEAQSTEVGPADSPEESSGRNSTVVNFDAGAAVETPAEEPHEKSITADATTGVNQAEFKKALAQISPTKQVEQPGAPIHQVTSKNPPSALDRNNPEGHPVQGGNKKPGSKIEPEPDESALPVQVNRERIIPQFHSDVRPIARNGIVKADPDLANSLKGQKGANVEVMTGIANAGFADRGSKSVIGSPASEASASSSHLVETAIRLPESFVPGGTQLLVRLSHQEMRFGWNTPDFGHVEVRATVEHDRVGAVVSADARLCDSLQADLGSLSRSLANQSLQLAHFQTSSSNSNGNAAPDQNAPATEHRVPRDEGAKEQLREVREPALSIHQGALDLRA